VGRGARRVGSEGRRLGQRRKFGTDDPNVFSAYLCALRWNTATAADRDLFQAPFRAGIHQDAYQVFPLRKALRLPRVDLLIADDVGAGKTVEAGLVLRELLLRRRVDLLLVAAPAGMVRQWQDELEIKFGLSFTLVDREHLATLRRERGYTGNPWSSGSRFIISHSLMARSIRLPCRSARGRVCPCLEQCSLGLCLSPIVVAARKQVPINIHCHDNGGVPEPLLHDLGQ
jgi:hypothetical protein